MAVAFERGWGQFPSAEARAGTLAPPSQACRAALDWTAAGGCPHVARGRPRGFVSGYAFRHTAAQKFDFAPTGRNCSKAIQSNKRSPFDSLRSLRAGSPLCRRFRSGYGRDDRRMECFGIPEAIPSLSGCRGSCKRLIAQRPARNGNDLRAMPSPGRAIGGLAACG